LAQGCLERVQQQSDGSGSRQELKPKQKHKKTQQFEAPDGCRRQLVTAYHRFGRFPQDTIPASW